MGNTGLAVLSGLAQGFEKATMNIYNIGIAKEKLKQERETFNLDKKVKEAQLNKYANDPNYDPEVLAQQTELLKRSNKFTLAKFDLADKMQEFAKAGETKKLEEANKQLQAINNITSGFKLGATGNVDEQIKRKVATSGLDALTSGEKELWARMGKSKKEDTGISSLLIKGASQETKLGSADEFLSQF